MFHKLTIFEPWPLFELSVSCHFFVYVMYSWLMLDILNCKSVFAQVVLLLAKLIQDPKRSYTSVYYFASIFENITIL